MRLIRKGDFAEEYRNKQLQYNLCKYNSLIPPIDSLNNNKKFLVLDMDNTLINA